MTIERSPRRYADPHPQRPEGGQGDDRQPGLEAARERARRAEARRLHPRLHQRRARRACELKIELKYHEGEPVIREITRVSKPGRRVYSKIGGAAARLQRSRHLDPVDAARRHVGRRGARRQCRRRSPLPRVLRNRRCRALARIRWPCRAASPSRWTPAEVKAKGKLGELAMRLSSDVEVKLEDGKLWVKPVRETKQARMMWGTTRNLRAQHGDGRVAGLHQVARDQRRRLSRRGPGQEPEAAARLQPRRQVPDPGRISRSSATSRPRSRSPAPTSSASARSRPRSAASARPSPTRARASSMRARRSCARKARRSRATMSHVMKTSSRPAPAARALPAPVKAAGRPAAVGVPLGRSTSMPRSSTTPRARRWPPPRALDKDLKGGLKTGADMSRRPRPSAS